MTDPRIAVIRELGEQLQYGVIQRNRLWEDYWREGRRMVTVPDDGNVTIVDNMIIGNRIVNRPFPSFPNLAPKDDSIAVLDARMKWYGEWAPVIRDCIARLKSARAKESTNRNLSTLLAVVVKVQKDLETLVGEEVSADAMGGV